ncbi:MAG: CpsD/CapB family tyrosine-protein kinase [Cyanobacteria bacterium P01_C01_bin.69]
MDSYDARREQLSRPFLEAFRRLANNIQSTGTGDRVQSLTISSAVPNEGKSALSFYLAHACASLGQRTLLVDTDLRHPTLHKLCNVSNEKGLSSYIAENTFLNEILIDLPTEENFTFMPSGPAPADPTKILSSKKMEALYQHLYETFDIVIFDTPPLLGFTDAFMVTKQTQGLLLSARLGQVTFAQLEAVIDESYVAKIPTLGVVANCSDKNDDKSYRYHQYYKDVEAEKMEEYIPYVNNTTLNGKATGKTSWQTALANMLKK